MKYKLTDNKKEMGCIILYQIEALKDFGNVKKGDKGGWIEKEDNLSQEGNAWVFGDAKDHGDARVYEDAKDHGDARVYGDAKDHGDARVHEDAWVCGDARVYGDAKDHGDARVCGGFIQ